MVTSVVEILNVFLLVTSDFAIHVECSDSDFLLGTAESYTLSYDIDYTSRNMGDGPNFRSSSAPLVSNIAVTGQEPFQVDENFVRQKVLLENELILEQEQPLEQSLEQELEQSLDYFNSTTHGVNCSVNSSCGIPSPTPPRAPTFQQSALTRVIVLLLIAIFSLIGNIATLSSILRTGRQGTSTVYMLLVQLAVADLLVSAFCILADALWTLSVQWYGGNFLCKGVKFMQLFSLYLSTFLLVLIGFDRLCAVRFPMRRARAKHHVRTGIVCVWILSALFSLPQVFIFSVMRGPFAEEFYQCVTYAFYTAQWQEQLYTTLSLVLMFLLPLAVLVATYAATFLTIASRENVFHERASRSPIDGARQKILRRAKVKSLTITVVIVLTFLVCWTPYYVTMLIFVFLKPGEQLSRDLQEAVFFFGSSTAAINPLIYGAFHLRPRRRRRRSKSNTTSNNHSGSSRIETCSHGRSSRSRSQHGRKSENIGLQVVNGDLLDLPCKHRYSCYVSNVVEHRGRVVHHQNSIPY